MNKRRTTVYVDEKLYTAFNVYKQQKEADIYVWHYISVLFKYNIFLYTK